MMRKNLHATQNLAGGTAAPMPALRIDSRDSYAGMLIALGVIVLLIPLIGLFEPHKTIGFWCMECLLVALGVSPIVYSVGRVIHRIELGEQLVVYYSFRTRCFAWNEVEIFQFRLAETTASEQFHAIRSGTDPVYLDIRLKTGDALKFGTYAANVQPAIEIVVRHTYFDPKACIATAEKSEMPSSIQTIDSSWIKSAANGIAILVILGGLALWILPEQVTERQVGDSLEFSSDGKQPAVTKLFLAGLALSLGLYAVHDARQNNIGKAAGTLSWRRLSSLSWPLHTGDRERSLYRPAGLSNANSEERSAL